MKSKLRPRLLFLTYILLSISTGLASLSAENLPATAEDSSTKETSQKASSEDSFIPNYHSLGKIANHTNIYRCANPVGSIADQMKGPEPTEAERQQAKEKMKHLYDLGVRTVVSLQRQEPPTETEKNLEYPAVVLEKWAAQEVGITYVPYSMANRGKDSLQYMSDDAVLKLIESIGDDIVKRAETGGVAFHCKSGKDRTGLVAAYLRIKYQNWSFDQAIVEMRQNGHVWQKFLKPGNTYSWHEEHLRAIAQTLAAPQ